MPEVHILNGDALLNQFPESVVGERLVMRECMIEGPIHHTSLDSFFKGRIEFLKYAYQTTEAQYQTGTISEFEKLKELPGDHDINLWFEQDLFCQTNLWFICAYLMLHHKSNPIYLIMPGSFSPYGFSTLNTKELGALYNNREPCIHLKEFAALWELYRLDKNDELWQLTLELSAAYPFLKETVKAHLDRIGTKDAFGRPTSSLIRIMKDLQTTEFGPVFKEFCAREWVYGFGDIQVKRIFDEIISSSLYEH